VHEVEIFRPTLTKLVDVLNRTTQDLDLVIDSQAALANREALLRELAAD
jgi:hypothetical protein